MITDMLYLILIHTTSMLRVTAQINLTPFGTATQSSTTLSAGPDNAINPPVTNTFSMNHCTHTRAGNNVAWWMFQFSFGAAYITDITIYYRESFAYRMDGFRLFVTNTSAIPPDGYLCYEDPDPGLPNITITIPCYQIGRYIIYFDTIGDGNNGPLVELCYVAIIGCRKGFWGSSCEKACSKNCIERHCYPRNGSCVWGCNTENCLNDFCSILTGVCTDGCKLRRTGDHCNEYNIASDGLIAQYPSGNQPASFANDGSKKSCSKTKGPNVTFQVDLKKESSVTGAYITFGDNTTKIGRHIYYASNTSDFLKNGTILYEDQIIHTRINFSAVFRYLTYVPPVQNGSSELEICEIGILGCPPTYYGSLCDKSCPRNCHGPCDLQTGNCSFGCANGWIGDKCEQTCQDGTYGKDCLETCSATCFRTYCNKATGECIGGCDDGWQGFDCTQKCSSGQFGKNCSEFCEGCLSQMCDHVHGLCDNSTACKPGYVYDKHCNTACDHGFYGSNCLRICSSFCLHLTCDPGTGKCIGGCVPGFQGFNCTQVSLHTSESDEVPARIGFFSGGVLLGILLTIVVCCLIPKTPQIRKKRSKDNATKKTKSHDQQHYDDVAMENVSAYQNLGKDGANEYEQINTAYVNH